MSTYLESRRDPGGERHYIDDVAIHAGDFIRARVDGKWVDGRYEASWRFGAIVAAWFYYGGTGPMELTDDTPVELTR